MLKMKKKCSECAQHPLLRCTGESQEINERAEWACPVCDREYWFQANGDLSPDKPEDAPSSKEPKEPEKSTKWGKSYRFKMGTP